ncbi:hypothetical protein A7U60_g8881 [Sanghuangporus baumii]|uniref:Large ribosomal subunit protein mL54 n=1 Tax=Sanghuangporus baumii TaxID=108892 RepID=A0A9Q5HQN3_SANBA|nr:hypothetical protein A7U60_g8881 [Sanghuangporus baumii]
MEISTTLRLTPVSTMHRLPVTPFASLSRCVARSSRIHASSFSSSVRLSDPSQSETSEEGTKAKLGRPEPTPLSSCPENTVLNGLNYLKGQEPVIAKKDEEYPPWLWTILKPKPIPDDGPGGKGEKMRLRAANRQRIKEQNFLKTQ